jgi:Protein phosphatase 2C
MVDLISSTERDWGALASGTYRASFARVVGPAHLRRGAGCDDAAAAGVAGSILAAVVCDGAGSAAHGGEGARTVAPAFVEHVLSHACNAADVSAIAGVVRDAVQHCRGLLEEAATANNARLSSYATTLVACVSTPSFCLHVQIGDGAFVAFDGEDRAVYLGAGRAQEYANETYFVTDRTWEDSLLTKEIPQPRSALLMTDGVVPFALDESRETKTSFCLPIVSFLRDNDGETGAKALLRLLSRADAEDLVYDDKTLLWLDVACGAVTTHEPTEP